VILEQRPQRPVCVTIVGYAGKSRDRIQDVVTVRVLLAQFHETGLHDRPDRSGIVEELDIVPLERSLQST
jgi:hypothetical protein